MKFRSIIICTILMFFSCKEKELNELPQGTYTIVDIAAGNQHSIIKLASNDVYGSGSNGFGQLAGANGLTHGVGNTNSSKTNKFVNLNVKAFTIHASDNRTYYVLNHELYGTGSNNSGQLGKSGNFGGIGNSNYQNGFLKITDLNTNGYSVQDVKLAPENLMLYVQKGNDVGHVMCGFNRARYISTDINSDIVSELTVFDTLKYAFMGKYCMFYCKQNSNLLNNFIGVGNNEYGKLGNFMQGDWISDRNYFAYNNNLSIRKIVGGNNHNLLLTNNGDVYAVGKNDNGQLGDGTNIDKNEWTYITSGVTDIVASQDQSMLLKLDGTLWSFGNNEFGQLGTGDKIDRNTPTLVQSEVKKVAIGGFHSIILKNDGKAYTCGSNNKGQLGQCHDDLDRASNLTFNEICLDRVL